MSRSAGTLMTTHNATYIPPSLMPHYKGHCPTIKYDYGETYGHATQKYFQDYRSKTLNSSYSNYAHGGQFPTYYTHQPDLVISNRTRTMDRFLSAPRYELTNLDHDRTDDLRNFSRSAQAHREHYRDKSGTVPGVNDYLIPKSASDDFKVYKPFIAMQSRFSNDFVLPDIKKDVSRRKRMVRVFDPLHSNVRDREMRDVYFEHR